MLKKQKELFLKFEANNWFQRNKEILGKADVQKDLLTVEVENLIENIQSESVNILEIGCGNGHRLSFFKSKKNVKLFGIDPSQNAIEEANKNGITAKVGTADLLDYNDDKFDIVIFGFCLYLCDREDLFKIASEANRVLKNSSYLVILDFYFKNEKVNSYHHLEGVSSFKMDYKKLFEWHPSYTLIKQHVGAHADFSPTDEKDDMISVSILRKYQ